MRNKKNISIYLVSSLVGVAALLGSASALAQVVGTLEYLPNAARAIPVGGGFFLVLLGVLLAALGYRTLSRGRASTRVMKGVFLGLVALSFTMAGGQVLYEAKAGDPTTTLSNPGGGIVHMLAYYQEYYNTSGTVLRIDKIDLNCDIPFQNEGAPLESGLGQPITESSKYPMCEENTTVLGEGDRCYTNYPPCKD